MTESLSTNNHNRAIAGLTYVYPVVSRRAGGISVGINLNINNACNWRCIYCQVPNLKRGGPEPIDLARLADELRGLIEAIISGDFYRHFQVEPQHRLLKDIALSGNGEPTSARELPAVIDIIGAVIQEFQLNSTLKPVMISNGSLINRPWVESGLQKLNRLKGEVWFKIDRGDAAGRRRVNSIHLSDDLLLARLNACARQCHTKIQTCVFEYQDQETIEDERQRYVDLMRQVKQSTPIDRILLYTPARPSTQPERKALIQPESQALERWAQDLARLGFKVSVNA